MTDITIDGATVELDMLTAQLEEQGFEVSIQKKAEIIEGRRSDKGVSMNVAHSSDPVCSHKWAGIQINCNAMGYTVPEGYMCFSGYQLRGLANMLGELATELGE